MAQALLMALKFGLLLNDTSVALGISKGWTLRLRQRFGRIQGRQEVQKDEAVGIIGRNEDTYKFIL